MWLQREKQTYSSVPVYRSSHPSLCLDKKDLIVLAQLEACEMLEYVMDEDKNTGESEITELKMALDFLI